MTKSICAGLLAAATGLAAPAAAVAASSSRFRPAAPSGAFRRSTARA
jgi:hypothetical protein